MPWMTPAATTSSVRNKAATIKILPSSSSLLCRGRRIPGRFEHIGDFSHRRVHSRADNDAGAAPPCDQRSHESHILQIAQRYVGRLKSFCLFRHGKRFTRKSRFFYFKALCLDKPEIGADSVSACKTDNISRNELFGRDLYPFPSRSTAT